MVDPQSSIHNPHSNGFTLIEIVITIVIVSILAFFASMIILQGAKAYSDEQSRSDAHYQARLAMERMARDIRLVRSRTAGDIPTMNPTDFRYTDIQGNQMGFRLNASSIERTQDNGVTWRTLATGITALTFNYLQQNGAPGATAATLWLVEINVTDQRGSETLQMLTRMHPRNF